MGSCSAQNFHPPIDILNDIFTNSIQPDQWLNPASIDWVGYNLLRVFNLTNEPQSQWETLGGG
jgi:hypothetical protein